MVALAGWRRVVGLARGADGERCWEREREREWEGGREREKETRARDCGKIEVAHTTELRGVLQCRRASGAEGVRSRGAV